MGRWVAGSIVNIQIRVPTWLSVRTGTLKHPISTQTHARKAKKKTQSSHSKLKSWRYSTRCLHSATTVSVACEKDTNEIQKGAARKRRLLLLAQVKLSPTSTACRKCIKEINWYQKEWTQSLTVIPDVNVRVCECVSACVCVLTSEM